MLEGRIHQIMQLNTEPIFIYGTGRCGTSILQRILSFHKNIFSLRYEGRFITTQDGLISVLKKRDNAKAFLLSRAKFLVCGFET